MGCSSPRMPDRGRLRRGSPLIDVHGPRAPDAARRRADHDRSERRGRCLRRGVRRAGDQHLRRTRGSGADRRATWRIGRSRSVTGDARTCCAWKQDVRRFCGHGRAHDSARSGPRGPRDFVHQGVLRRPGSDRPRHAPRTRPRREEAGWAVAERCTAAASKFGDRFLRSRGRTRDQCCMEPRALVPDCARLRSPRVSSSRERRSPWRRRKAR